MKAAFPCFDLSVQLVELSKDELQELSNLGSIHVPTRHGQQPTFYSQCDVTVCVRQDSEAWFVDTFRLV
jgi:hypothetical protein